MSGVRGKIVITLQENRDISCEFEGSIEAGDLMRMLPTLKKDYQLKYVHLLREEELKNREKNAEIAKAKAVEAQIERDTLKADKAERELVVTRERLAKEKEAAGIAKEETLEANKVLEAGRRESLEVAGTKGIGLAMAEESDKIEAKAEVKAKAKTKKKN